MNNKTLLIIFVGFLAIYLLSRVFTGNRESSFDPNVVSVDTNKVDEIRLFPKAEDGKEIKLLRSKSAWTATMNQRTVNVPNSKMGSFLSEILQITAKRIVSKSSDNWSEYEVGENGTRVQVYGNGKLLEDFIVGTFKFDQARRSASSYLRSSDADDVYLVDGFLSMQFNQGFDAFRDKQVFKINKDDLLQLSFETSEQDPVGIEKLEDDWYFAGMEKMDSTKIAQYLNGITNVIGAEFADGFTGSTANPLKKISLSGDNLLNLEVSCFSSGDSTKPFILYSSTNPESYFLSDSAGIYDRIFGKLEKLLEER